VSARKGGKIVKQFGYFADKEGGRPIFAILCGRLLWTRVTAVPLFYTSV